MLAILFTLNTNNFATTVTTTTTPTFNIFQAHLHHRQCFATTSTIIKRLLSLNNADEHEVIRQTLLPVQACDLVVRHQRVSL